MTDSYSEDRFTDYNPQVEDWSIRGDREERERQESLMLKQYDQDQAELAEMNSDCEYYEACELGLKHGIEELAALKDKLLPILKEIKEKEEELISHYNLFWFEDDDQYDEKPYFNCETEEEMQVVDLQRFYKYEVVTPWVNQFTPI